MSNITLNIVEPGGPTPDPVVPNTGLFTHGIGGPEATILGIVAAVVILAAVIAVLYYRNKKQGKSISLKHKKATFVGLASLAIVISIGTVASLLRLGANATEGEDGLTLDVSSEDLTIEVGSEPVFAVLPVELTVEEATQAGYTLTAFTDSTDLVSTTDESKTIPIVTVEGDELVALTDNTYGLALAEPVSQAEELYTTLSTDADAPTFITDKDHKATEAGDTTTIYYGFYITPDVPYGTYTGSDVYYDAEKNDATILTFDGNDSDGGIAMEGMTIIAGDTITLPENTYTRAGYSFTGWNTAAEGTGKAYADEAEFTASLDKSEDVTLYAQWALPVIGDLTEMQDFATLTEAGKASVLASMTPGQQYQLQDNRDQMLYYIAKLADGHVWMTQNLDLDLKTDGSIVYDATTTNISSAWTPTRATISFTGTSVSGWTDDSNTPYSADPGPLFFYSSGTTSDDDQYTSLEACQQAHSDCSMHNHAGNYYNWSAAVAMNSTSGLTTKYSNASGSICPAGWRLPTGRDSGNTAASREWNALLYAEGVASNPTDDGYTTDGFNKIRKSPLWLARSGYVYGGLLNFTGSFGYYWSSTVNSSSNSYLFYFGSGFVYPADYNGRYYGYSVRCIAQ